jgi:hypothetical protein
VKFPAGAQTYKRLGNVWIKLATGVVANFLQGNFSGQGTAIGAV